MQLCEVPSPAMQAEEEEFLPTRASLLARIKDLSADASWMQFFNTYWKLIYNTARHYGLTPTESQEVVQETMIGVSRNIGEFQYDPRIGSFKSWLMKLTLWRIKDQLRKRKQFESMDRVDVTAPEDFTEFWHKEWQENLVQAAIEIVKKESSPKTFQIYSLCVLQNRGPQATAQILNVSVAAVYLITHRLNRSLRSAVKKLEKLEKI